MSQQNAAHQPAANSTQPGRRDPAAVLATSSFSSAILMLPTALQRDARRLYHLLRTIDDLVDEHDPRAPDRVEAIERWAHGHDTETPEVATLNALAQQYPLSHEAFLTFCEGMRHDLAGATIETDADLTRYCEQAGGAVGVMLACLLGTTHPDGEHQMALLGTAMQHTNILRDIDEDRAHGRTYIPQSTIARFGPPLPGAREQLLRHEIQRADATFEQARDATRLLTHGQHAMALSAALYREILRQIERDGYGRKEGVAKVPEWRKTRILTEQQRRPTQLATRASRRL